MEVKKETTNMVADTKKVTFTAITYIRAYWKEIESNLQEDVQDQTILKKLTRLWCKAERRLRRIAKIGKPEKIQTHKTQKPNAENKENER